MSAKKLIPLIIIPIIAILVIASVIIFLPISQNDEDTNDKKNNDENGDNEPLYEGKRKAIICCSANDFYGSDEDEFNSGNDSNLDKDDSFGNWTFIPYDLGTDAYHDNGFGYTGGSIYFDWTAAGGQMNSTYVLDWNAHYTLVNYAYYNVSAWVNLGNVAPITGVGARIGIQWLNSSGKVVRTDWSNNITLGDNAWHLTTISSVCNNKTEKEITALKLILQAEGNFPSPHSIHFDEIKVDKWISVNISNPSDPPPPQGKKDSDGFPAQALQVYWTLKNHGYKDDDILLMLYYKGDNNGIDIEKNDGILNDLNGAVIDIANDSVTANKLKQELNVSISGSFASEIKAEDQLIIYLVDHGSNKIIGDGNATFHFEADKSYITEFEFYNLVKQINCRRILINIDCCFSGNFLNKNNTIGQSWYDLSNCLLISASANVFSWYWIDNNNGDGFAGSWFFHQFWDQLNQNKSIITAFNFALNFIPSVNQGAPLIQIQTPLIHDNLGINNTWSFNGTPEL
ncbi:MAG: C13 family peptidase [Promethearchaeota archaeon]